MALVPADNSFLSLLNVERKQALDRQKKREDLLEDTEHGSKILGLHQDLQALADVLDERVESKLSANEKGLLRSLQELHVHCAKRIQRAEAKGG
eukprot:Skav205039  [mRNA]  locus=scaffold2506:55214:60250:+ [translate_table: standard]